MFDSHFPFTKINHVTKTIAEQTVIMHNYCFKGKQSKRYLVQVEQYDYHVFVVKFYLADHRNDNNRYGRLSRQNECSRVISTVCRIMLDVFMANPFVSFAFVGSPLPNEQEANTKRFRLYSKVIRLIISPIEFEHYHAPDCSGYLLLNRHFKQADLLNRVLTLFKSIYGNDTFTIRSESDLSVTS